MTPKSKLRIAVVDDHPVFRDGIRSYIKKMSDVELMGVFSSGEEFMPLIDSDTTHLKPPDIVFMDIRLPGMDGVELTKRIIKKYPHIKVVAVTMCSEEYTAKRMFQAGASGYLTKG